MPPTPRVRFGSRRKNFSKMRSCSAGGIPRPSSLTRKRTRAPLRDASSSTVPPSGEYLTALSRRFASTCRSLSGSAAIAGRPAGATTDESQAFRNTRLCDLGDLGHDRGRVAPLDLDLHPTRLEAACPEDVVDDPREPVRLARDHIEETVALLRLHRDLAVAKRHRRAVDRGERRPQLVGDGRDEVRLQLLDRALVRHVAERVDGAAREADGRDR